MARSLRPRLASVTLISITAKLSALLRDMLFASLYGTGEICSAFEGAYRIPLLLFDIFFGCAIGSAFIPVFCGASEAGQNECERFANGFAGLVLSLSAAFTVLGMIFSQPLLVFFAKGVPDTALGSARLLLVLLFPTLFIDSFSFLMIAIMHARNEFLLPASVSLVTNTLCIAYLLLGNNDIYGFAAVSVFGGASESIILYRSLKKHGFLCKPSFDLGSKYIKNALSLSFQGFLPYALTPVISLLSISFANGRSDGNGIAIYSYAHKIFMAAAGFFTFIFSSHLLPYASRLQVNGGGAGTGKLFCGYARALFTILLPITVALIAFPERIVEMIFMRGSFSADDCISCAAVLRRSAIGIPFFAFSELSVKVYLARQRCVFPSFCAAISIVSFAAVTFLMPESFGLEELALAASFTYISYSVMLFFGLGLTSSEKKLSKRRS